MSLRAEQLAKPSCQAILDIVEEAMDEVAREFMHTVTKEWKNLRWIDEPYLQKQAEALNGAERATAERCQENVRDPRKIQQSDRVSRADVLVRFLEREAQVLEEAPPVDIPREWMFCFVLFLLMELGRLVSISFSGCQVKLMDHTLPGTGERAERDKPYTELTNGRKGS